jgi:hypothetical protein
MKKSVLLLLAGTLGAALGSVDSAAVGVAEPEYKVKSWSSAASKSAETGEVAKSAGSSRAVSEVAEPKYKVKSWGSAADKSGVVVKTDSLAVSEINPAAAAKMDSAVVANIAEADTVVVAETDSVVVSEVSPSIPRKTLELKSALRKIAEIRGKILSSEGKISKILNNAYRNDQSDAQLGNLSQAVDLYGKILSRENEIAPLLKKIASDRESAVDRIAALDRVTELYDEIAALENQINKLLQ